MLRCVQKFLLSVVAVIHDCLRVLFSTGGGWTGISPPIIRRHGRHRYRNVRVDEADKCSASVMLGDMLLVHLATLF